MELGRKFRGLKGAPKFQTSVLLEVSRSSPGALFLSAAGLMTSLDELLNSGAEFEGDVSPDALLMLAWLIPLLLVSICHFLIHLVEIVGPNCIRHQLSQCGGGVLENRKQSS